MKYLWTLLSVLLFKLYEAKNGIEIESLVSYNEPDRGASFSEKRRNLIQKALMKKAKFKKLVSRMASGAGFHMNNGSQPLPAVHLNSNNTDENGTEPVMTSSNTLNPDACGRSIGVTKQTQTFVANPDLDFLSQEDIDALTVYKPCELKSGLIYMLEKEKSYEQDLKLVLIYLKIDKENMYFYQSRNPKSLFHQIAVKDFIKIGQTFANTSCFDVVNQNEAEVTNPNTYNQEVKSFRGSLTLCTLNLKDERIWVKDIFKMKECSSGGNNVLADFTSVNQFYENSRKKVNSTIQKTSLYYSPDTQVYAQFPKITHEDAFTTTDATISPLGRVIQEIQETVKNTTLQKKEIKKQLAKKLEEVKKTNKQIKKKENIIQRLVESRYVAERDRQSALLKMEQEKRQLDIMKKAKKDIRSLKVNMTV